MDRAPGVGQGAGPEPLYIFLDFVNLAFRQAVHPFFGLFGDTLGLYGGTIGQLVFPVGVCDLLEVA